MHACLNNAFALSQDDGRGLGEPISDDSRADIPLRILFNAVAEGTGEGSAGAGAGAAGQKMSQLRSAK